MNGITFKYYVASSTTPSSSGRRLLSQGGTYDFNTYGRNKFRSARMPNQNDRAEWLQSVRQNALKSYRLQAASDLDSCRVARAGETGSDQSEFRTGTLPVGGEGNSAYSVSNLPEIDVLNVCDDTDADSVGRQYGAGVLSQYGYSVGDNLKLSAQQGSWRRHRNRKLRQVSHQNKLEAFHNRLMAVSDPTPGFLLPQADNLRDCKHDGKNFCSFSQGSHVDIAGYCSDDCSDCKAGQCTPCATTTDCEMCNVVAPVPATKVDPTCVDLYGGSYTSSAACIADGGETYECVKTHECLMTTEIAGSPGEKCDPLCVDGVVERKVNSTCDENTCEDKSSQPVDSVTGSAILGQCQTPVDAATCQELGNCGLGISCTANDECNGALICETGKCAVYTSTACSYAAGKSIDDMDVAEIKAAFVTGTDATDVAVNSAAETAAIQDEQTCECAALEAEAKLQGTDQAVIDQMNTRISQLQALVTDGSNGGTPGSAHKAIGDAETALRNYLTNTASGAQEIARLEGLEAAADTARATARAAALQVAAPAYLNYYRDVVQEASFSGMAAREDAYALYEDLEQNGDLDATDLEGEDDTYLDELHRIFAACQGASDEKEAMGAASSAAGSFKIQAAASTVKDGKGDNLNIADCVAKSTLEFNAKKALDDKEAQITAIETSIQSKGYVPASDIVKKHKHYSCCTASLQALEDLERCVVKSDCSGGGECIGHFCVPEPCLCSAGHDTNGISYNTDDFPIDDDDCDIQAFDSFCGDGTCDVGEDATSCALDCRCGDGKCEADYFGQFDAGETCITCASDCSAETHYNLEGVSTECPPDIHADGICGCYPDSSGLNCETLAHSKDCNCETLCVGYDSSNVYSPGLDAGLSDATTYSDACATVSDCTAAHALDDAVEADVNAFCTALNAHYEIGAIVNGEILYGRILKCGKAATETEPAVNCPAEQALDANITAGDVLDPKYRCAPIAAVFLQKCQPHATTGVIPNVDFTADGLRPIQEDTFRGLEPNCVSIREITGINTPSQYYTLSRYAGVRQLQGLAPFEKCVVGVTQEDPDCVEWEHKLGCPASCSCPAAVQPVFNHTNAVNKGDVIKAEVAAVTCDVECTCGDAVKSGMLKDSNGDLYSTTCFNTCPAASTTTTTTTTTTTGAAQQGQRRRLLSRRELHETCTGTEDPSTQDEDCSAITQAAMTMAEYEAAVGACFIGNANRVHKYYCEANGGVQGLVPGCVEVAYEHKQIAHDGTSDECYGLNGYDASVTDSVASPAQGCRNALGVLTGAACYYGDGTNCKVGDAIAKAGEVVAPVVTNTPAGHVQSDGSYLGGNQVCDNGETVTSCAADCRCGDNVCGLDAKGVQEDGDSCDIDCIYSCRDSLSGGCYEFSVVDFPIGQWNKANGYTADFDSFKTYCASWAGNLGANADEVTQRGKCPVPVVECPDKASDEAAACHVDRGGADVSDGFCDDVNSPHYDNTGIGCNTVNSDVCDCGRQQQDGSWTTPFMSRSRKPKVKKSRRKLLQFGDSLKEWAKKNINDGAKFASASFKSLINKVSRRRSLLAGPYDSKPTDRAANSVPWLQAGAQAFDDAEALCLGSQQSAIENAIQNAFNSVLTSQGLNVKAADYTVSNSDTVNGAIAGTDSSGASGIALVVGAAIISLDAESARKSAVQGVCSASEKAIVHTYAQSWVPVEHCYPLKFVESTNILDTDVSCMHIAGLSLAGNVHPTPSEAFGGSNAFRASVRDGFMSVTKKFKYLTYTDETDVTSQCSDKGVQICSAASAAVRTGGSCKTIDSGFPVRQSCVNEFKKNLADIAGWLGGNIGTGSTGADAFKTQHVAIMGADTENALGKLKALRQQIGDADASAATIDDANSKSSIQSCWEAYETNVGYVQESEWITASGALLQAINAVKEEEKAIIQVHADAKAECKEHCIINQYEDKWSTLTSRCDTDSDDPSTCKCRRRVELGAKDSNGDELDAPVLCNCMFDNENQDVISETSMQLYNGAGKEDCQNDPSDYIAGVSPYSQGYGYAIVANGESPTQIAEDALIKLVTDRKGEINTFVNKLSLNLQLNLAADGLLGQQNAQTMAQVCSIMNHEVGQRDDLQLSDENAMDNFFDNYMKIKQNGTVADPNAARRLASEPCSLCD